MARKLLIVWIYVGIPASSRISASGWDEVVANAQFKGQTEKVSLGKYPLVSLKAARLTRDESAQAVHQGVSPAKQKQLEKHKDLKAAYKQINDCREDLGNPPLLPRTEHVDGAAPLREVVTQLDSRLTPRSSAQL